MGLYRGRHGNAMQASRAPRQKQLIFDRRYGWVYEEYTDPIEVAHLGGRGMFSIVPLSSNALHAGWILANKIADQIVLLILRPKPSLLELTQQLQAQVMQRSQIIHSYSLQKASTFLQKWHNRVETSRLRRFTQHTLDSGLHQWQSGMEQCQVQAGVQVEKLQQLQKQGKASAKSQIVRLQETVASSREHLSQFTQHTWSQIDGTVTILQAQLHGLKSLSVSQLQRLPLLHALLHYRNKPKTASEQDKDL